MAFAAWHLHQLSQGQRILDGLELHLALGDKRVPNTAMVATIGDPRMELAAIVLQTRIAQARRDGSATRAGDADSAELAGLARRLALLKQARPIWGERELAETFLHYVADGPRSPQTLGWLLRSYDSAPFMRDAATWRVVVGLNGWDQASPMLRHRVLSEAIWIGRLDGAARKTIFAAARGTESYVPLARAWRSALRAR